MRWSVDIYASAGIPLIDCGVGAYEREVGGLQV